jgi:DNA-binding transcriptional LysR family regulator
MSSRIAALEDELGVLLLDRRDKQVRLTAAGGRFLVMSERLLSLQREIRDEMGRSAESGLSLRIGAIESVLHSWLIDWVREMRAAQPGLELELTVETTPVLVDQMRRGRLDLALAALPAPGEGLRQQALPPMPMCFVGQRRHRSAAFAAAGHAGTADLPAWLAAACALVDWPGRPQRLRCSLSSVSRWRAGRGWPWRGDTAAAVVVAGKRAAALLPAKRRCAAADLPDLPRRPWFGLSTVVDALRFKATSPVHRKSMT